LTLRLGAGYDSVLAEVTEHGVERFIDIAKALGDQTRVRILMMLDAGEELCLCQIIDVLGLAPSTVSQHLSMLQRAGLVERRKEGRWHFFRPCRRGAPPEVRQAWRWVRAALDGDATIAADIERLCCACAKDRAELAECYRLTRKEHDDELLRVES